MGTLASLAERAADEASLPVNAAGNRLRELIYEAYCDVVARARLNPAAASATLTAGQSDYSLSAVFGASDLMLLRSVRYTPAAGGRGDELEQIALVDARSALASFSTIPGYTRQYARSGDKLILVPAPTGSDTAFLDYDAKPDPFDEGDEPPLLPPQLHEALVWGALARDTTVHDPQRKAYYEQRYIRARGEVTRWAVRSAGQRPRFAVIGSNRVRPVANDIYPGD